MAAHRRTRRKIAIVVLCLAGMLIAGGAGAFYFGVGAFDIGPASRSLDADAAKYRAAGWPWEANDLLPKPRLADKDNAAPMLKEAIAYYKDNVEKTLDSPEDYGKLAPKLPGLDKALDLAAEATRKPGVDFGRDWDRGPALLFPEFSQMKSFVKDFSARAEWRCAHGDVTGAIADLKAGHRMGEFAAADPILIAMLVDLACIDINSHAYQECAAILKGNEPALRQLSDGFDPEHLPSLAFAMRGEAYMGISLMRNLDRYGGARAVLSSMSGPSDNSYRTPNPATLRRTGLPTDTLSRAFLDHHLRFWTGLTPMFKNDVDPQTISSTIDQEMVRETNKRSLSGTLDDMLLPVFSESGQAIVRARASVEATRALLMAMEIQARTGAFPKSIDQIPGKWMDPFSKEPLKLKTDGKSIRIYSVGPDHKDDGGLAKSEIMKNGALTYDIVAAYPPIISKGR